MKESPLHVTCLCHLVWEETLFQRPQQLMRRMAERGSRVVFLAQWGLRRRLAEARRPGGAGVKAGGAPEPRLEYRHVLFTPGAGRFELARRISLARLGGAARRAFERMARAGRREGEAPGAPRVLWVYHPNHIELLGRVPHDLLIYDCMDHFAGFRSERREVAARERALAERADLVFTGGRSLHNAKKDFNARTHCFPSGVEVAHFARAAAAGPVPAELARLPAPRLGYFGAVDERIDWALIRELCRARPGWSVVFLGPLVMMSRCPVEEPNFHHLGPKPYAQLPDYLRGFDACLMPFVQSELVAHISPTKTPEYLAGGRPVVSTPVPDVIADYAEEVEIAATPGAFVEACERALGRGAGPSRKPPASRTWDEIAEAMDGLIRERLGARTRGG